MNGEEKARQISQVTVRLPNKFPAGSREAAGTAVAEASPIRGMPDSGFRSLLLERAATAKLGSLLEA